MLTRLLAAMTVIVLTVPIYAEADSHPEDADHNSRRHHTQERERAGPRTRASRHAQDIVNVPHQSVSRVVRNPRYQTEQPRVYYREQQAVYYNDDSGYDRHTVRVTHTRRRYFYGYHVYTPTDPHGYPHYKARRHRGDRRDYRYNHRYRRPRYEHRRPGCDRQSGLNIHIRF